MSLAVALNRLGYAVVPESHNFQFEKPIPNSAHTMRVELLAPDQYKRKNNFRVDIGDDVHARACLGGSIVLAIGFVRDFWSFAIGSSQPG